MNKGVIACGIAAHVPTLSRRDLTPDYQLSLLQGELELGRRLRSLNPEVWVIISTHWVSTFNWFVTMQETHKGICVADEAPDLIPGIPYNYQGDPSFAQELLRQWSKQGIQYQENKTEHFSWDYGTYVPLSHLDPGAEIPVLSVPVVIMANKEECHRAGEAIYEAAKKLGKRTVVIASSALSHSLARGREQWPTDARKKLDLELIHNLEEGAIEKVCNEFDDYSRQTVSEMGGRAIATMLGTASRLQNDVGKLKGKTFGDYSQSSGSGNINLILADETTSLAFG